MGQPWLVIPLPLPLPVHKKKKGLSDYFGATVRLIYICCVGHCYLMMDDLQQAYAAYQNALINLRNPKVGEYLSAILVDSSLTPVPQEPKLWYGIGILYDRYGSLDHAEEAFSQVMQMEPGFEKANEIYFRLGIIYKQQQKYGQSLEVRKTAANIYLRAGANIFVVLQVHCQLAATTVDGGRHLVSDWSRPRAAEGLRQCKKRVPACAG
jgi:tetratricopeptide (TPR) repeat protein